MCVYFGKSIRSDKTNFSTCVNFSSILCTAPASHPVAGGTFPPPPAAAVLLQMLPPPDCFRVSTCYDTVMIRLRVKI